MQGDSLDWALLGHVLKREDYAFVFIKIVDNWIVAERP